MSYTTSDTLIPRRPLLWLAAALLFTVPPMFDALAAWVPVVFLASLLAKFWLEKRGLRLRSVLWKVVGCVLGVCGVALSYGSLRGLEQGLSTLLVLASFKMLEAHTARDFHILVMLGWFLCLCGFFNSQSLGVALYVLVAFGLLLAAMIQFHRGPGSRGVFWPPLRAASRLLLQAFPLAVLMFFLFPRGSAGLRFYIQRATPQASAGLPDRLSPGSIASITASQNKAFRVEFPDGNMPPPATLYWRGGVMWLGNGMNWQSGVPGNIHWTPLRPSSNGIRQRITIEPNNGRWMFALDRPSRAPAGAWLMPGNFLQSEYRITSSRRYDVTSFQEMREPELSPDEWQTCMQVPPTISDAVRELVQTWKNQNDDPRAMVQSALRFFQTQGFRYSLSPGEYREDALDEFLFRRKIGFCEHYAASFATLMRVAEVPSRVVVGYQGGQFNALGGYLVVRQADAHAWCEVWLPGSGWTRVDATSVVAPDRINLGFDSFVENSEAGGGQNAFAGQGGAAAMSLPRRLFNNARLAWDTVNYAWDARVVSFDAERQEEFLEQADLGDSSPVALIVRLFIGTAVILGIYVLWMWLRTRGQRDPVKALYDGFCHRAARAGALREAWEGPADFAERSARLLPNEAERIRRLTSLYISLRYAPKPSATMLRNFANEVKAFSPRPHGEGED